MRHEDKQTRNMHTVEVIDVTSNLADITLT